MPVPTVSLNEAAAFELCHSPAWDNKVLAQVYWVYAEQVSKTPPTGMNIGTGSFMIRGKRNFMQPDKLELGQILMFCLTEESLAGHIGERKLREDLEELADEKRKELEAECGGGGGGSDGGDFDGGYSEATSFWNPNDDDEHIARVGQQQ